MKLQVFIHLALSLMFMSCADDSLITQKEVKEIRLETNVTAVGARSSGYGFYREDGNQEYDTFPSPEQFGRILSNQSNQYPGSTPCAVWIVGVIGDTNCMLEFPAPDDCNYPNITFDEQDKHEPYLSHFDSIGVKVYLQVEAGMADMKTLIKLVLDRYGHHTSVVGFGIDIEWYPSPFDASGNPVGEPDEWGTTNEWAAISNEKVKHFDEQIKKYDSSYRLFLKHWEAPMCGSGPISDVIYINDSQGYDSMLPLLQEFKSWANYYAPNTVGFQIGYGTDESWWAGMENPLTEIGDSIIKEINNQPVHLYWVDFTLDHELMSDLW